MLANQHQKPNYENKVLFTLHLFKTIEYNTTMQEALEFFFFFLGGGGATRSSMNTNNKCLELQEAA
jgi:hypothetical protein